MEEVVQIKDSQESRKLLNSVKEYSAESMDRGGSRRG